MSIVGYCAVVIPSLDHYQGYFINDDKDIVANAANLASVAVMTSPFANPYGSVQAAMVEGAVQNNSTVVAAAALALRGASGDDYFYVRGEVEPQGIRTSLHKLDASSVDEARALIEALPEVVALKERLLTKLTARDGRGRKTAFH